MPFCSECGIEVPPTVRFCGNCGRDTVSNPMTPAKSATPTEQVIFNLHGVFISNSRYMSGGQTYAMAGITSVKMTMEQPSRTGPVISMVIGGLFILGGLGSLFRGNPFALLFGVALFLLGLWIFRKRVPIYRVVLHSSSGEQKATHSTIREFIEQVVAAVNQAIVTRG